jgi:hypothetical protein
MSYALYLFSNDKVILWQISGYWAVMEAEHAVLNTSGRQEADRVAYHWLSGVSAGPLPSQQPESCHMP